MENNQAIYMMVGTEGAYIGETSNWKQRKQKHITHSRAALSIMGVDLNNLSFIVLAIPSKNTTRKERIQMERQWRKHFESFRKVFCFEPNYEENIFYKGEKLQLIHDDGREYSGVGVSRVAREIGISQSSLSHLVRRQRKHASGWRLKKCR